VGGAGGKSRRPERLSSEEKKETKEGTINERKKKKKKDKGPGWSWGPGGKGKVGE